MTSLRALHRTIAYVTVLGLTAGALRAQVANWPSFRGPFARGGGDGTPMPAQWNMTTGENIRWQTPIPGLAHASPIAWGDRVFVATVVTPAEAPLRVGLYGDIEPVTEADVHQWRLVCLNTTDGSVIWNGIAHEGVPRVKRHPKASHCNSTPATDGHHIVAIFGSEGLFCFDMAGKQLWHVDLGPMDSAFYRAPQAQWGFAASPVIYDGKVIVQCDVMSGAFLAAFDVTSGAELWRTRRDEVPTWSTPTVDTSGPVPQILVNGYRHSGGYDLATGAERWRLSGGGDIPVPTPVVAHGLVFLTSAHGPNAPMRAIHLEARGDITPAEGDATHPAIAWSIPKGGNYMQTPIVVGNLLYACSDNGWLTCFDALSGDIHYRQALGPRGGFTASPVAAAGKLYVTSERGEVFVVAAGPSFRLLGTQTLGETCLATPAIVGDMLLFRTRTKLVAIALRPRPE